MEPVARTILTTDWITIVLLGSLVFLLLAKLFFYPRFLNFILLPFNNKYIALYNKKERLFNWFQILLTLFFLLNGALFLYLTNASFSNAPGVGNKFGYPLILGALLLFLFVKVLLQLGNGLIFGAYQLFNELVYKKLSYLTYSGIVLFLSNVALNYIFMGSRTIVYIGFFLFLSINVIGWFTVIKNSQKLVADHFFYFILYLCALEIAPLIITGNLLK
jgi:hypothetical protein